MSPAQEAAIRAAAIALHETRERLMMLRQLNRPTNEADRHAHAGDYAIAEALAAAHDDALRRAKYQWQEPGPPLSSCLDELAALITTQAPHDALSVALERARRALEGGV